ncbi:MAG: methionine biosynthesis protein MetW [Planctomycetaceae bacterium]|nr:methionine biosynthesis protein MetW [Planctomycetaceae bacterium]
MPDPLAAVTDDLLMAHIPRGSRVIDLGCGDGRLLQRIRDDHDCSVLGVEVDMDQMVHAIERGIPVLKSDLDHGLELIPDGSFDFAVLSQTLQQVHRPLALFDEIFRIARSALVVVPNFGHWRVRLQVLLSGRAPVTDALPYDWFESPNVHFLTMLDFRDLATRGNFRVVRELPIIGDRAVDRAWMANARAHSALFLLERSTKLKNGTQTTQIAEIDAH